MNIEELSNLDPELAEKLRRRGYRTVESIASAKISDLASKRYGITKTMARRLKSTSRKTLKIDFRSATKL